MRDLRDRIVDLDGALPAPPPTRRDRAVLGALAAGCVAIGLVVAVAGAPQPAANAPIPARSTQPAPSAAPSSPRTLILDRTGERCLTLVSPTEDGARTICYFYLPSTTSVPGTSYEWIPTGEGLVAPIIRVPPTMRRP